MRPSDNLINNAGGTPASAFGDFSHYDWIETLESNMLTLIELVKATIDGVILRRFGGIVNITSAAIKTPIPLLRLSNGARAGLTGFSAGLSRQTPTHDDTINNILPGAFITETTKNRIAAMARRSGQTVEQIAQQRLGNIPAEHFSEPLEFGQLCGSICSAPASYITGRTFLIDGGACSVTF